MSSEETTITVTAAEAADLAFHFLQKLSSQGGIRIAAGAKPVVFELLPDLSVCWSFDPQASQGAFSRRDIPDAPLRIVCKPEFILQLLFSERLEEVDYQRVSTQGDVGLLTPMAQSLRSNPDVFSIFQATPTDGR